ncbi:MAG TPA: monofunctional biosynthetic peptidoglycan transglycosylase [Anaeromyxobacteraceae bacterium]|nr:monofunctional biosynthetic peptidoglycan transglycosylase [Anaeromyxobacteraceae bacterium]
MRRLALGLLFTAGALLALVALLFATLPSPLAMARANPRTTALIEQRRVEARRARRPFHPRQVWVPLDRISPRLIEAVLVSEDASFFAHGPFDLAEMSAAARDSLERGRRLRGASTLTQQLAKNLWLGTERSLLRKAKEAVLAVKLERSLTKRRILTLYLNVVEWDEGVFGAEAAAQARFGVHAADLTTAQATLLAAMLPAPRRADLALPPRWLARRARRLVDRLLAEGKIDPAEHAHASAELERILSGATGDEEVPDEEL